jgi:hypothetical protein
VEKTMEYMLYGIQRQTKSTTLQQQSSPIYKMDKGLEQIFFQKIYKWPTGT